jgi:hypothetical protein
MMSETFLRSLVKKGIKSKNNIFLLNEILLIGSEFKELNNFTFTSSFFLLLISYSHGQKKSRTMFNVNLLALSMVTTKIFIYLV